MIVVFFLIKSPTQRFETNKNSVKRAGPAQKSSVGIGFLLPTLLVLLRESD